MSIPENIQPLIISLSGIALGFLSKTLWDQFKKKSDSVDLKLEKFTEEIHKNTLAMTELRVEMRHMSNALKIIPELEKDLNALGKKVRENYGS